MILQELDDEIPPPMAVAIKESEKSNRRFKLGAVITKKKKILGKGFNSRKTHPRFGSGEYNTLHAETHALYRAINAGHDVSGSTMYVYRSHFNLAKPCQTCQQILQNFKIEKVIYTA